MTLQIASPQLLACLACVIVQLTVLAAYLWRRLQLVHDGHDQLAAEADMQGDALREALNEIDRLRRLKRRR